MNADTYPDKGLGPTNFKDQAISLLQQEGWNLDRIMNSGIPIQRIDLSNGHALSIYASIEADGRSITTLSAIVNKQNLEWPMGTEALKFGIEIAQEFKGIIRVPYFHIDDNGFIERITIGNFRPYQIAKIKSVLEVA